MKLVPLRQFICDKCGELIASPEDGWLQWRSTDEETRSVVYHDFIIVHHFPKSPLEGKYGCYHHSSMVADDHLTSFVGHDGFTRLLGLFRHGIKDPQELVDIIRRLHTPYYEEARMYWEDAMDDYYFEGANENSPYIQESLVELIRRYGQ